MCCAMVDAILIIITVDYTLQESAVSMYVTGQLTHCSDHYATC